MKKVYLIGALLSFAVGAMAANDFTNSYALFSTDASSAGSWYSVYRASGSNPLLNGQSWTVNKAAGEGLYFNGGVAAYRDLSSNNTITVIDMYYRIYAAGADTSEVEWTVLNLKAYQIAGSSGSVTGRYSNVSNTGTTAYVMDVTEGLENGDYIFETYITMTYTWTTSGGGSNTKYIGGSGNGAQTSTVPTQGSQAQFTVTGVTSSDAIPEPATMALLGLGGAALALRRRMRK